MPKVLRIINRFNLGGPTYNAAYLTRYMNPEYETLLVGGYKDETEEKSEYIVRNLGIDPVIIPEMRREINPRNDLVAYRKLKRLIEYFKPDIVHTHASKAGTLGRIAASRAKVPVVLHTFHGHVFHSYFNSYKSSAFKMIEQGLAKRSTRIIAISEKQKQELSHVYNITDEKNIEVVPLGFDLGRFREDMDEKRRKFRQDYHIGDDEIAIGIIGRLVPIKNHGLFLESLRHVLNKSTKKIRAFIVGDGECRQKLEEKASELNIPHSTAHRTGKAALLTFTSWLKDVDYVYAGMDIISLTSLNEGTPVSLIEAQAACKPIVTTNVGGIENITVENETALLAKKADYSDYPAQLLRMVEDGPLRASMSEKGWAHVSQRYHYTRLVDDMKNLYGQLLHN